MIISLMRAGALAVVAALAMPIAADAADIRMPVKGPVYKGVPRSVISYYNWTGFYVGANVGYAFGGSSDWTLGGANVASISPKGMLYGATLGYNWQFGSWVYGIEGDYNFSDVKGSSACPAPLTCESKLDWVATFRGRIGYAFDRLLPYFTVGGAYGEVKATTMPAGLTASNTNLGLAVGGGLEYAFLANWTTKIEYLYVDLGKFTTGAPATEISFSSHIVRAGLNYRF